jgi:hypothetical protein
LLTRNNSRVNRRIEKRNQGHFPRQHREKLPDQKNKWKKNTRCRGNKGSHLVTPSDIGAVANPVKTRRTVFFTLS